MRAAASYSESTHTAAFPCPVCGYRAEVRFVPGRLWLGSIYAAGAAHFCPESEHRAPEITGVWMDGQGWHVRLGDDEEVVIAKSAS